MVKIIFFSMKFLSFIPVGNIIKVKINFFSQNQNACYSIRNIPSIGREKNFQFSSKNEIGSIHEKILTTKSSNFDLNTVHFIFSKFLVLRNIGLVLFSNFSDTSQKFSFPLKMIRSKNKNI